MGLATAGSWKGSLSGNPIDGVDMWTAIMTNSSSPRTEILHRLDDTSFTIQQKNIIFREDIITNNGTPGFVFEKDLDPDSTIYTCPWPSLMTQTIRGAIALMATPGYVDIVYTPMFLLAFAIIFFVLLSLKRCLLWWLQIHTMVAKSDSLLLEKTSRMLWSELV